MIEGLTKNGAYGFYFSDGVFAVAEGNINSTFKTVATVTKEGSKVTFDWDNNSNAYYYQLQVSENADFFSLMYDFLLNESIYPIDYFNGSGVRYWRVRFVDASGTGGPWSEVRSFTVKPQ